MTRCPYAQKMRAMQKRRPSKTLSVDLLETSQRMAIESHSRAHGAGYAGAHLPKGEYMSNLIRSRKFWASVAGLLLIVVQEFLPAFPLDAEQVTNVIYVLVAFIIGTGLEDSAEPK